VRYFVGSQLEKLNWDNDRGRELPRSCVRLEVVHTVRSHDAEGVLDIAAVLAGITSSGLGSKGLCHAASGDSAPARI